MKYIPISSSKVKVKYNLFIDEIYTDLQFKSKSKNIIYLQKYIYLQFKSKSKI